MFDDMSAIILIIIILLYIISMFYIKKRKKGWQTFRPYMGALFSAIN